jgi:hypothetical protein
MPIQSECHLLQVSIIFVRGSNLESKLQDSKTIFTFDIMLLQAAKNVKKNIIRANFTTGNVGI